jgi:hypothetical protein
MEYYIWVVISRNGRVCKSIVHGDLDQEWSRCAAQSIFQSDETFQCTGTVRGGGIWIGGREFSKAIADLLNHCAIAVILVSKSIVGTQTETVDMNQQ